NCGNACGSESMALTAVKAKSLREPGRYTDGRGLMLYINGSGSKSWVLRLMINGKRRDIGLGSFKDVSLADAREKAEQLRKLARTGEDPLRKKHEAKSQQLAQLTFRE